MSLHLLLLFALLSFAGARNIAHPAPTFHNRAIYTPHVKRLSADVPAINPNVSYVSKYSRPHNTGLTDLVAWDRYSFYVKGQRLLIYGGEFHPFRQPVVSLWFDVLQKMKAAGANTVSIYVPWMLLNPSEGVIDMDGFRNYQTFFDQAKEVGLWVIARPGPFINAETSGGGIPGWCIRKAGDMRTNSSDYQSCWPQYIDAIVPLIARNQISEGGPVIMVQLENEFRTGESYTPHMEELKSAFLRNGVVVPLSHNNPTGKGNFAAGSGAVDIAGLDAYPGGFSCAKPDNFATLVTSFNLWSERVNRDAPYYFAEIQGGSFDPWGGIGYDACRKYTGADFERVQTQFLLENRVTMINKYMFAGGTGWGGISSSVVYTSYDYGTFVGEDRSLATFKYHQYKLLGLFLRSAPEIRQTEVVGYFGEFSHYSLKIQPYIGRPVINNTIYTIDDRGLWTTELRNPDSLSAFYLVRQATWTTSIQANFSRSSRLMIWTPDTGDLTIPQFDNATITIGGRDSRIIPTDFIFGSTHLRYSTASVLLGTKLDEELDLLVLYGIPGQTYEVLLAGLGPVSTTAAGPGKETVKTFDYNGDLALTFAVKEAMHAVVTIGSLTVVVLETAIAYTAWQPTISPATSAPFSSFPEIGTNQSVVVTGPYLVRNASIVGSELQLVGDLDLDRETAFHVYAPSYIDSLRWNGVAAPALFHLGQAAFSISAPALNITLPALENWSFVDSIPEIRPDYDDSSWIVADKMSSNATVPPLAGTPSLSATDYGFVVGNVIWRGAFDGDYTGVSLTVEGGLGFGFSVWLGSTFLGGLDSILARSANATFSFPANTTSGDGRVLTVLQDHMGLDQDTELDKASKHNRGITSAVLLSPSGNSTAFKSWKVQGNRGGELAPDKLRGALNEGGLFAERQGFHLPETDVTSWNRSTSISNVAPGVRFFRMSFPLELPADHDIVLAFVFDQTVKGKYRSQLYVNGWQMGKLASSVGPQTVFPVPEGILKYQGQNVVGISLWSYGKDAVDLTLPGVKLQVVKAVTGGIGRIPL